MGNESIDLSLDNIYRCWFLFRKGKTKTLEFHNFNYHLEKNLFSLCKEVNLAQYCHGGYRKFIVNDNKKREISVATLRDRVVHRVLYEHLVDIYDKSFIYDVWSCRRGKGLLGAIERAQKFISASPQAYVWRCDIKKFFESVDHKVLLKILSIRIKETKTLSILKKVVKSYHSVSGQNTGMPIGNLTSQIFANIYFDQFDKFIKHKMGVKKYLRYGDDFLIIESDLSQLKSIRYSATDFLKDHLKLTINAKTNLILKPQWGIKYLGVKIYPTGHTLTLRNFKKLKSRITQRNVASYFGIINQHLNSKKREEVMWDVSTTPLHPSIPLRDALRA